MNLSKKITKEKNEKPTTTFQGRLEKKAVYKLLGSQGFGAKFVEFTNVLQDLPPTPI